ncbi:insulinase family protein, partial [candidate division WOR-3 bacterium]|nr:insulinase family protein [candidate division WOR-3 bacterium]
THPLSSPILGTPESVSKISTKDIQNFWQENYTTNRMFVSAVGRVEHDDLCNKVEQKLGNRRGKECKRKEVNGNHTRINMVRKPELNHEYVALTSRCFPYDNQERFPFLIGLSILGVGMSSRLFQKLRQEMGLVYYVSAFTEFFRDTGIFGIYLSTDKNKLSKTLSAIVDLLNSLKFSSEEINIAKERTKGNIVISLEDNTDKMVRNVKEEMYLGERLSAPELLERIDSVKFEEVRDLRKRFFKPEVFDITILGRSKDVIW